MTAQSLVPDEYGQVYIATAERIRCVVDGESVCVQYDVFADAPILDEGKANGIRFTAAGELSWLVGDLGGIPTVELSREGHYSALGWDVLCRGEELQISNATTGKSVTVSPRGAATG